MIEVIGNPPKEVVEWAEKMGFELVIFDQRVDDQDKFNKFSNLVREKRALIVNTAVSTRLRKNSTWLVKELRVPIELGVQLTLADLLFDKCLRILGTDNTGFSYNLESGSIAFTQLNMNDFFEAKENLETFLKGFDIFAFDRTKLEVLKPIIKFEIPTTEELEDRIKAVILKHRIIMEARLEAEVFARTAQLEAQNNDLRYKLNIAKEELRETRRKMYDEIRDILKTVSRGWKLVESNSRLYLFYPKEIKPTFIIHEDGILKIPEDENPFFVRGVLIPIESEVTIAYAIAALHPNVNPDPCTLFDFEPPRKVYSVCIGDLKNKSFHEIAEHIINTLSSINLLSAFSGKAEAKAIEIIEEHRDKSDEEWEVNESGDNAL